MSDCYDYGDPKGETEFVGLDVCVFCGCPGGYHTLGCQAANR